MIKCPSACIRGLSHAPVTHPIERLNKLLIHTSTLWVRVAPIFVKDGSQAPLLYPAKTAYEAACSVLFDADLTSAALNARRCDAAVADLALVAVYQHWVISRVEHDCKSGCDLVIWDCEGRATQQVSQ